MKRNSAKPLCLADTFRPRWRKLSAGKRRQCLLSRWQIILVSAATDEDRYAPSQKVPALGEHRAREASAIVGRPDKVSLKLARTLSVSLEDILFSAKAIAAEQTARNGRKVRRIHRGLCRAILFVSNLQGLQVPKVGLVIWLRTGA